MSANRDGQTSPEDQARENLQYLRQNPTENDAPQKLQSLLGYLDPALAAKQKVDDYHLNNYLPHTEKERQVNKKLIPIMRRLSDTSIRKEKADEYLKYFMISLVIALIIGITLYYYSLLNIACIILLYPSISLFYKYNFLNISDETDSSKEKKEQLARFIRLQSIEMLLFTIILTILVAGIGTAASAMLVVTPIVKIICASQLAPAISTGINFFMATLIGFAYFTSAMPALLKATKNDYAADATERDMRREYKYTSDKGDENPILQRQIATMQWLGIDPSLITKIPDSNSTNSHKTSAKLAEILSQYPLQSINHKNIETFITTIIAEHINLQFIMSPGQTREFKEKIKGIIQNQQQEEEKKASEILLVVQKAYTLRYFQRYKALTTKDPKGRIALYTKAVALPKDVRTHHIEHNINPWKEKDKTNYFRPEEETYWSYLFNKPFKSFIFKSFIVVIIALVYPFISIIPVVNKGFKIILEQLERQWDGQDQSEHIFLQTAHTIERNITFAEAHLNWFLVNPSQSFLGAIAFIHFFGLFFPPVIANILGLAIVVSGAWLGSLLLTAANHIKMNENRIKEEIVEFCDSNFDVWQSLIERIKITFSGNNILYTLAGLAMAGFGILCAPMAIHFATCLAAVFFGGELSSFFFNDYAAQTVFFEKIKLTALGMNSPALWYGYAFLCAYLSFTLVKSLGTTFIGDFIKENIEPKEMDPRVNIDAFLSYIAASLSSCMIFYFFQDNIISAINPIGFAATAMPFALFPIILGLTFFATYYLYENTSEKITISNRMLKIINILATTVMSWTCFKGGCGLLTVHFIQTSATCLMLTKIALLFALPGGVVLFLSMFDSFRMAYCGIKHGGVSFYKDLCAFFNTTHLPEPDINKKAESLSAASLNLDEQHTTTEKQHWGEILHSEMFDRIIEYASP